MADDKTKCVMHTETDATTTVGRSIPVCATCAERWQAETKRNHGYHQRPFHRRLKWAYQQIVDAADRARRRNAPPPIPIPEIHPDFAGNEAGSRHPDESRNRQS